MNPVRRYLSQSHCSYEARDLSPLSVPPWHSRHPHALQCTSLSCGVHVTLHLTDCASNKRAQLSRDWFVLQTTILDEQLYACIHCASMASP